jgi:hypothetical protein
VYSRAISTNRHRHFEFSICYEIIFLFTRFKYLQVIRKKKTISNSLWFVLLFHGIDSHTRSKGDNSQNVLLALNFARKGTLFDRIKGT